MKTLKSLLALSLVALLPTAALAQTSAPTGTDRTTGSAGDRGTMGRATADRQPKPERQAWSNTQGLHETGDIIGTSVQDSQGKSVGKIDALLIDPKDGKVSHAVIGLGGLLGVGKERVVVSWSDLRMSGHQEGRKAAITLDQSTLDRAPKYVKTQDRQPSASPAMGRSDSTTRPGSDIKRDADRPASNPNDPKTDKR
jgi:sporulation protein YlmC with PRC-barrel domain